MTELNLITKFDDPFLRYCLCDAAWGGGGMLGGGSSDGRDRRKDNVRRCRIL